MLWLAQAGRRQPEFFGSYRPEIAGTPCDYCWLVMAKIVDPEDPQHDAICPGPRKDAG